MIVKQVPVTAIPVLKKWRHLCPWQVLKHILFRQTEIPVAADDQVVVDGQVEGVAGLDQGPGQLPVRGGGREVAAGGGYAPG